MSLQLYIISMWWTIVTHYVHPAILFCISCSLLFLNLPPGFTLAMFKKYSLSSKLVCPCTHTPPTAERFYHWKWSQLDSLILLWQPSRIKFLLHHICSHLSIPSLMNLDWKYAHIFLVLTLPSNTKYKTWHIHFSVWQSIYFCGTLRVHMCIYNIEHYKYIINIELDYATCTKKSITCISRY